MVQISALKSLDFFGEPITLLIQGQKKFTTYLGTFFSFSLLLLLIVFSSSKISSMLYRTNKTIDSNDKAYSSPIQVDIKGKFAFSLNSIDFTSITGKKYFDFQFTLGIQEMKNGTLNSSFIKFDAVKCTFEHFPNIQKDELLKLGIQNWICPKFDNVTEVFIQGKYLDEIYRYIRIDLMRCSNSTLINQNDVCAGDLELEKKRSSLGKIYVSLVLVNNYINLNDYEKPFTPFVETMDFLFDFSTKFLQREIYFTPIELKTDSTQSFNFLRDNGENNKISSFIYDRKYDEFSMNENKTYGDRRCYSSLYLRSDKMTRNYFRRYDTFQDVLQTIGSLYSILYILFKMLNLFFIYPKYIKFFSQSLYKFSDRELKDIRYLGTWRYFLHKFTFKALFSKETKVVNFNDIVSNIHNDLDIFNFLRGLKQLEWLKNILLSQEQILLLNLMIQSKFDDKSKEISQKKLSHNLNFLRKKNLTKMMSPTSQMGFDHLKELNKISDSFETILSEKNETSQKLIKLLDLDLIKYILKICKKEDVLHQLECTRRRSRKSIFQKVGLFEKKNLLSVSNS